MDSNRIGHIRVSTVDQNTDSANVLKEAKRLCKEFGFTAGMLRGSVAEGRKKQ